MLLENSKRLLGTIRCALFRQHMTYWVEKQPDSKQQLKYYGGIPRLGEVQKLGEAYVYLLSDAASFTTSINIPVNGVIGSKYPLGMFRLRVMLRSKHFVERLHQPWIHSLFSHLWGNSMVELTQCRPVIFEPVLLHQLCHIAQNSHATRPRLAPTTHKPDLLLSSLFIANHPQPPTTATRSHSRFVLIHVSSSTEAARAMTAVTPNINHFTSNAFPVLTDTEPSYVAK